MDPQASLRVMIGDVLRKHMYDSAVLMAEKLTRYVGATIGDTVLFADCYFYSGQYRRCLAVLEQSGLLSAQILSEISAIIHPSDHACSSVSNFIAQFSSDDRLFDKINAVHLGAKCLLALEEYEDCIGLLDTVLLASVTMASNSEMPQQQVAHDMLSVLRSQRRSDHLAAGVECAQALYGGRPEEVNPFAGLFFITGKCYDMLDNRRQSLHMLVAALQVDVGCLEAAEYLVSNGLVSRGDSRECLRACARGPAEAPGACHEISDLFNFHSERNSRRACLKSYYEMLFGGNCYGDYRVDPDAETSAQIGGTASSRGVRSTSAAKLGAPDANAAGGSNPPVNALWLVHKAEYCYEQLHNSVESYRLSRLAYSMDPFSEAGLLLYIASMLDLNIKTELFYLAHELVHSTPKSAVTWYAIGCYYYLCGKYEVSQKYLQKSLRINKRFAKAFVLLGHVLSLQQENEHALAAYRTVSRLLPSDHRPLIYMAKELVKTSNFAMALHVLLSALEISRSDSTVLNELGAIYLQLGRYEDALEHLGAGAKLISISRGLLPGDADSGPAGGAEVEAVGVEAELYGIEIFSNYATCLRKLGYVAEALQWYRRCLILDAKDARVHANIGFTLHLLRRFDEAIEAYHRALSLQPDFAFCTEMLTAALHDVLLYKPAEVVVEPPLDTDAGRNEVASMSVGGPVDISAVGADTLAQSQSGSQHQSKVFINASNLWQPSPGHGADMDTSYGSEELNSTFGSVQESRVMGRLSLDSSGMGSASAGASMLSNSLSAVGQSLFGGKSMSLLADEDGGEADELAYYETDEDQ